MTGSEIGRALACTASQVLPRSVDASSEWSDEGEQRHLDAEVAAELGDLDSLPPKVSRLIAGAGAVQTELAIIYDAATDTARPLPGVKNRAYPVGLSPYEVPMTVDLIAHHDEPRRLVVVDHKLFAAQGPPKEHGQLMTEALAAARAFGVDEVTIAISYLGTSWVDIAEADMFDLADHAERLRQLPIDVAAARQNPEPRRGPHCRHCPAFFSCPAWKADLARALRGDTAIEVDRAIPFDSDAAASGGLLLLEQLKQLASRLEGALRARAKERPIPVAGTELVWGPVPAEGKETLDGTAVYAVALELYGREVAARFVEMTTTKKRIGEETGHLAPRGEKTRAVNKLVQLVRDRGGAHRKKTTKFEPYDPKQLPAAPAAEGDGDGDKG